MPLETENNSSQRHSYPNPTELNSLTSSPMPKKGKVILDQKSATSVDEYN